MAAKKKKITKANGVQPADVQTSPARYLPVQPPVDVAIPTEAHAPILAKARKKKKNRFGNVPPADNDGLQPSSDSLNSEVTNDAKDNAPFVLAEARNPDEFSSCSPTYPEKENNRHWGFQHTNHDEAQTSQLEVTDAPVDLSSLGQAGNNHAVKSGGGQPFGRINVARQEALEAVSDFKTRILERAALKKTLNDTPFTPSPYPNDLYLYDNPSNTPEDTTMLDLKRRFDAAIIELDSSLAPAEAEIPLNIAKRTAMYICGLLQSHDCQFRCALDGLRVPVDKDQAPLAPWVADTWEERLLDSDRDWLVGKKIDDMDNEKARKYVGECMEFIMKYKLWGHMAETECAEMGVQLFPRLS